MAPAARAKSAVARRKDARASPKQLRRLRQAPKVRPRPRLSARSARAPAAGSFAGLPVQELPDFPSDEIRAEFEGMLKKGRWPGFAACAFTGEGRLDRCVFSCSSGKADIASGRPMSADTICRLYSMTKAFIGLGILRLSEQGKLGLDDPVHRHLPEPIAARFREPRVLVERSKSLIPAKSPITIRQLLTHTSGMGSDIAPGLDALTRKRGPYERMYQDLSDRVDGGQIRSLSEFVEALSKIPLWQHPGREFYYSYGYDVLGYILEVKSGLGLDAFLRREVFEPLGLRDTGFAVPPRAAGRLARLYRFTKACKFGASGSKAKLRPVKSRFVKGQHCRVLSGGGCVSGEGHGGLTSTLREYATFLVTVFNRGEIPGSRKRLFSDAFARGVLMNHCAKVAGSRPDGRPRICAHNRKGVGLNLMGEVQLQGCEADKGCLWFDGVPGLVQWGGAATTFYKYQVVNGRPLLLIIFTQVLPQDDGRTCSASFQRMREWAEAQPPLRRQ